MARAIDIHAKRLHIVESAALQFARTGYEATLMDAIASAAGVSKGSLYDYFKSKEDLFFAVFEWLQAQLLDASVAQAKASADAREQLVAFAEAAVGGFIAHIELYPVTLEVWAAAAKSGTRKRFARAMRSLYADYRRAVSGLIRATQATGGIRPNVNADVMAAVLIGAVDGILLQYWLDPGFDANAWVREFLSDLFEGIGSSKPKRKKR